MSCNMRTTKAQISLRIRAFVVRCLDSVLSLVSVTKISSLILASIAEQASLSLTWSETPKDTFSHGVAHIYIRLEIELIFSKAEEYQRRWAETVVKEF